MPPSRGRAAVCAMWRALQDGHTPRPLHENATTNLLSHFVHRSTSRFLAAVRWFNPSFPTDASSWRYTEWREVMT